MRLCKDFTIILFYIIIAVVNQCDNKSSVTVLKKHGPKGYQKLEYLIDKKGLREGNYVYNAFVSD